MVANKETNILQTEEWLPSRRSGPRLLVAINSREFKACNRLFTIYLCTYVYNFSTILTMRGSFFGYKE